MFVNGSGTDASVAYRDPTTGRHEFAATLERSHEAGLALAWAVLERIGGGQPLETLGKTRRSCAAS